MVPNLKKKKKTCLRGFCFLTGELELVENGPTTVTLSEGIGQVR